MGEHRYNVVVAAVGVPETGKSYWATKMARAHSRAVYVICHDPTDSDSMAEFPRFSSENDLLAHIRVNPRSLPRVLSTPRGEEVVKLAERVAESSKQAGRPTPALAYLDEVTSVGGAGAARLGDYMTRIVAQRRHIGNGLGIIFTAQSLHIFNRNLLGMTKEMAIFRLVASQDLKRLAEFGFPSEKLALVQELPDRHGFHWRLGSRFVADIKPTT